MVWPPTLATQVVGCPAGCRRSPLTPQPTKASTMIPKKTAGRPRCRACGGRRRSCDRAGPYGGGLRARIGLRQRQGQRCSRARLDAGVWAFTGGWSRSKAPQIVMARSHVPVTCGVASAGDKERACHATGDAMRQLIAGNWKMHCLMRGGGRARPVALASRRRRRHRRASCWSARPALHVAAVRRRWQDRRWPSAARTATRAAGRPYRRHLRADAARCRGRLGHPRPLRAPAEPSAKPMRWCAQKTEAAIERRPDARSSASAKPRPSAAPARRPRWSAGQLAGSLPTPFTGVVAYEPVWAIGTGKTATEADVAAMHGFIRERTGAPVRRRRAAASASCMAARSGRPTPRRCWRCRMSAARWSAAPA